MVKRDFIFIDEAGDPGLATPYYIQGLLHVTDESIKKLNIHLGAFRYFGNIRGELKSTKLNKIQKEQLIAILQFFIENQGFIKTTAVYLNKKNYIGPFLHPKYDGGIAWKNVENPTKFRHLMMRKLLEFHFENNQPQSNELELIIDRFHSNEQQEQRMKNYLRTNRPGYASVIPKFLHIIQADSRYVELLQVADLIAGYVKEKFFTHSEREFPNIFNCIKVLEIKK